MEFSFLNLQKRQVLLNIYFRIFCFNLTFEGQVMNESLLHKSFKIFKHPLVGRTLYVHVSVCVCVLVFETVYMAVYINMFYLEHLKNEMFWKSFYKTLKL